MSATATLLFGVHHVAGGGSRAVDEGRPRRLLRLRREALGRARRTGRAPWREGRANAEAVHTQATVVAASRGMVVGDLRRTALVHGRADTRGWKPRRRFQEIECLAST
jgi:hypothetical protein